MSAADNLIQAIKEGKNPHQAISSILEGVSGPERQDISPDQQEQMFQELIAQSEAQVPYLNHEYVDMVLGQLRQGAPAEELMALAQKNREDALASGANFGDPDFATWDAIHRSLTATFTDQAPPTQA